MLKKTILTLFIFICTYDTYSSSNLPRNDPQASQILVPLIGTDIKISLTDYMKLNPYRYKKLTGQKLKWKEAITLRITQKRIKKTIGKDGSVDVLAFNKQAKDPFKWHWGGFFLGLLVPILGMVIAAFIKDDQRKNRTTSACIGTLVACIAFIIFVGSSF